MDLQRLSLAVEFASVKHQFQKRKNALGTPYINHPINVMNILAQDNVLDIDTLISAVLHDTIEDTNTTPDEIEKLFGVNVRKIVLECTDDKKLSKIDRKKLQISHSKEISLQAKMVKMADKFSNIKDLIDDPPKHWSPEEINGYLIWCYAVFLELISQGSICKNLEKKLLEIFNKFNLDKMDTSELNSKLEEYYNVIKNSD